MLAHLLGLAEELFIHCALVGADLGFWFGLHEAVTRYCLFEHRTVIFFFNETVILILALRMIFCLDTIKCPL